MVLSEKQGPATINIEYVIDCSLLFADVSSDGMLVLSVRSAVDTTKDANALYRFVDRTTKICMSNLQNKRGGNVGVLLTHTMCPPSKFNVIKWIDVLLNDNYDLK